MVSTLAELEPARLVGQVGHETDERAQGVGRGGERLAGRDRPVGLDLDGQAVVVGGLLDAGRLDRERHPSHGREDRVDRHHTDLRGPLVAIGRQVAATLLDGQVGSEAALGVDRGEVQCGVEDLDVGGDLDVAGGDITGPASVEAQGHRLLGLASQHDVLEVEDEVGDVFLDPGDGVELVQRLVEAHLRDRGTGNRREQRAAQRVAQGVAEARLERRDDERLDIAVGLADLDLGTLDDEHEVFLARETGLTRRLGRIYCSDGSTWSRARR
jgi:hypothetical protein